MAFLLDHLSASVALFGLVILLGVLSLRRGEADAGDTTRYADARRTQVLVDRIAADLQSATSLNQVADQGGRFDFVARLDPAAPADEAVSYRLVTSGGATAIERWVAGARTWTSAPVAGWAIQALRPDGANATAVADAALIRVRIQTTPRPGAPSRLRTWETTAAPPVLRSSTL